MSQRVKPSATSQSRFSSLLTQPANFLIANLVSRFYWVHFIFTLYVMFYLYFLRNSDDVLIDTLNIPVTRPSDKYCIEQLTQ